MQKIWGLLLLSFIITFSHGQDQPIKVAYTNDPKNECRTIVLGSGFEKSGMVQYVARPKIVNSSWKDWTLDIKIFVVYQCCPPNYLGYTVRGDTLVLYYGDEGWLPNNRKKGIDICLCGYNGCCYEFDYQIKNLDPSVNYLVAILDVGGIGLFKPYPIGYLDNTAKSIYYLDCSNEQACFTTKIEEAISHYRKLRPIYIQLLEEIKIFNEEEIANNEQVSNTIDMLKKEWIIYFKLKAAIEDGYIKTKMDSSVYNYNLQHFQTMIDHELEVLSPILDVVSKYVSGGGVQEPIKKVK